LEEKSEPQLYCETNSKFLADRFVEGTCPKCGYEDARGDQCDKCTNQLNPMELLNPRCKLCKEPPIVKSSNHLYIRLKDMQPEIEDFVNRSSSNGIWADNAKALTRGWLKGGLEPRAMTRDLQWGVPVPLKGWEHKVMYVWFDAPIGYPSITSCYTDEWQKWWKDEENVQLVQFMGKDNGGWLSSFACERDLKVHLQFHFIPSCFRHTSSVQTTHGPSCTPSVQQVRVSLSGGSALHS
jgi:methionyl-tRNA synthetase